ncbi:MAG: type II toxin-antitoxin system VapC family toxin [Verrucomicrobia bacterium]|nr:type II toxin-antitoxin system VapC family toxin [Prolixibacteraceae bacterium]
MGRKNYLIDTNVAIYYFGLTLSKESEKYLDQILVGTYFISVINRIELLGFNPININESEAINSFITNATILELDEAIIVKTIYIRKNYSIKLPDAIIAATCLVNGCSLITNNIRDFEKISGLHLIKL